MFRGSYFTPSKTRVRPDRSPTSRALSCALFIGLRISCVAGLLASGSPWAQGDAQEVSLQTETRDVTPLPAYYAPCRWLFTEMGRGTTGGPRAQPDLAYMADGATKFHDPRGRRALAIVGGWYAFPSHPVVSIHRSPAAVLTRVSASGAGGGGSGSHGGASPSNDYFRRLGGILSPYFRVCTCDMIVPVPFRLPRTSIKACAMVCKCDDQAFGIGLYNTQRLLPFCSAAADTICPWQIKTISPSTPVGLPLPMQFTASQIVGCRLLESRPWE